ncbi:hypothetical protein POTOM_045913 [Populus tomentosa]|uniref:RNI-like superfamily protein n=1 Tax=Populus tomentosa TaxID=118781 RepID=A0A8X7YHU9_POPTO|nr:hypothetical protein POTOM_045913 [Populus tomentosa]
MQAPISNPFGFLTEEIIFTILDYLNKDLFAKQSFSFTCKAFYSIEAHHRKTLKPLRAELLSRARHRYPHIEHLDLTLCPCIEDSMLNVVSLSCKDVLCSINLSRSRFFTIIGLVSLVSRCFNFAESDLSNGVELNDLATAAISEAKNLEKLWLASDLGVELLALKCKDIRRLDLYYLQQCDFLPLGVEIEVWLFDDLNPAAVSRRIITEKCLPSILQLQHLADLVLEGCLGIDDDGLSTLQQSCKSLKERNMRVHCEFVALILQIFKTLNMSNCQNTSHVSLSSLTSDAENLGELTPAYGPTVTADLAKCLQNFSVLKSMSALASFNRLQNMKMLHLRGLTPNGLAAALLACRGITKVKLHASFKPLLLKSLLDYIKARCCKFLWRDRAFQVERDPKGWK